MYLQITAVLHASGGGLTGLALLALYNIAFIVPLVAMLLAVSNRRVLGQIGRWNRANSPWIKAGIAIAIIALGMALWMLKDVFLPGVGPSMMAPSGTHGKMQKAMERGGLGGMMLAGVLVGICTVPCSGAMYLSITAVLHASGGGATGYALLALYNIAFIAPLLILLGAVSNKRLLGQFGRWNRANSPWIKVGLALAVIVMSFGLMVSM